MPQFVQQKDQLYADLEKGRPSRTPNHADHNFRIQDYTLFHRDRSGSRGGGVAVYVSNRLSADRARVIHLSLNSCGHEYSHMVVTCLSVEYIIRRNRCTGRLHC